MIEHRDWSMWLAVVAVSAAMSGSLPSAAQPATAPPSRADAAATSLPVVPSVLVGPRKGPVQPPSVRPVIRAIPDKRGTVTYEGQLAKDLRVSIPAFRIMGTGNIRIQGNIASLHALGDGTLWVDKGSSFTLDPDTTGTITDAGSSYKFVGFSGGARASGRALDVRVEGARLMVVANGKGTATMSGEGMFRLTQKGGLLVSGFLEQNDVKKSFETVTPGTGIGGVVPAGKYGIPPAGLIPAEVLPGRIYTVPKLPSEGGERVTTGTKPAAAPPASAPPAQSEE